MSFVCKDCDSKEYASQVSFKRHLKEVHGCFDLRIQSYPFEAFSNKCLEGCNISFNNNKDLRQHLAQKHKILTQQTIIEFENYEEFFNWKANLNLSKDREYTITSEQNNGDLYITYYCCQIISISSPASDMTNTEESRLVNAEELVTTNSSCTSQMVVVRNLKTDIIVVTYFKTHYGHKNVIEMRNPVNCLSKKALDISSKMSERIVGTDQNGIPLKSQNQFIFSATENPRKKQKVNRKLKTKRQKRSEIVPINIPSSEQDSDDNSNNQVRFENRKLVLDYLQNECFNTKGDKKTMLKKEIIRLLQELSENDFEKYDENTLNQVSETLSECCHFLNSYERPEEPEIVDENPSELRLSPPSLLWYSQKNE